MQECPSLTDDRPVATFVAHVQAPRLHSFADLHSVTLVAYTPLLMPPVVAVVARPFYRNCDRTHVDVSYSS